MTMQSEGELDGILEFLRIAERLKSTPRSGWTTAGERESVAAHTWRLCLMATVLADQLAGVDVSRLLKICLVHDLGEALSGDVPAPQQSPDGGKAARERADLQVLLAPLPRRLQSELIALWEEYEAAQTPEAKLAKGLDKLETILQHTQGSNPADFDYGFNLTYGLAHTATHPLLVALRHRLDQATQARAQEATGSALHSTIPPLHATVTVKLPVDQAFDRFTAGLSGWWPREYTWSQDTLQDIGMGSAPGAMCYEIGPGGFHCDWGRVLAWEPPRRLLLAWQISPHREPEPNPARASEVELRFDPEEERSTRVSLTHHAFERHGEGGAEYREALAEPRGWPRILARYANIER
jgi:putative hydrolases of HD superfamily